MTFAEKAMLVSQIEREIIENADKRYKKINDLIMFT
jgi:hypothetical protein